MAKYILFIAVVSSLWHRTLAFHECDRNITGTQIIFSCNLTTTELNFYDLTTTQLNSITSIIGKARGASSTRGPFTSIPPNICFLPNLQTVDFSNNQIVNIDPTESLTYCLNNVVELNVANNNITTFPSVLLYNMPNLKNLYFQYNQLTEVPAIAFYNISQLNIIDFSYNQLTNFELWALEVRTRADFRFNQISTVTNKYFFTDFAPGTSSVKVLLSNNTATIEFTDAIYEMYDKCDELRVALYDEQYNDTIPGFTWKLTAIDFGTTTVKCSCDQYYLTTAISYVLGGISSEGPFGISPTMCFNDSSKHLMDNDGCPVGPNSTVDFTSVYPRLCKIYDYEEGEIINKTVFPDPTPNTTYPHYASAFLNPGACFFRFTSSTSMTVVRCSSELTTVSSQLSESLLDDPYMQGITKIVFPSIISAFPIYFCSLPSGQIDLSSNNFTTLTNTTFPCLDSFKKITLSNNRLTSVNTPRIDFQTLAYLDLSNNQLTELPYSILRPTPTSLRVLDLRNNSIRQLDLFIYTLKDITIYLDNNPIDPTNLTNTQNVTIDANSTSSVNISLPASVANRSTIIQDSTVATLISCATFTAIQSSLNYLRSTTNGVLLCTCASFTLKQIYFENENDITESFSCSNSSQLQSYLNLTTTNCPNAVYIRRGPCNDTQSTTTLTPPVQTSRQADSDNTKLIIGLVVGLVGGALLIGALIAAYFIFKAKKAPIKKPIRRANVNSQGPQDNLANRVQPRNMRSVRLAPLPSISRPPLPSVPVKAIAPTNTMLTAYPSNVSRTSAKGIPIRLDSVRSPSEISPQYPPNSNALNNSSSFRPINNNNISTYQAQMPQQQAQMPAHQKLNIGGD